jgi:hypothetical protein
VTDESWWLPGLREDLSQGDILTGINFSAPVWPLRFLIFTEMPKGKSGWAESEQPLVHKKTQSVHLLSRSKVFGAMVISHDCDIDKTSKGARIQLVPIQEIATLTDENAASVIQQKNKKFHPLPGIPGLGDCYADLRNMTAFPSTEVTGFSRVASMTDSARLRLHAAMFLFITRREVPPESLAEVAPEAPEA